MPIQQPERTAHQQILGTFEQREIDILIGTQMVSKGLGLPECHTCRGHRRGYQFEPTRLSGE